MPNFGFKHSEKTKEKIRKARANQVPPWLGKKRDNKTIEKIRQANLGKNYSPKTEFKKGHIPWNKGKKLHYKVVSAFKKGEHTGSKNHRWKGGVTTELVKIRTSYKYREWRKKVFIRDKYTCTECGSKSKKGKKVLLNADHIKPFSIFPELRLKISNGRTLCIKCHKKIGWKQNKNVKIR